jgi:arylsulfatase A-like enzyme
MEELRASTPTIKKKENMLEYLIALYDSEINYLDYHIGNLIYKLGLDKNSLIVITSDHGEEFLCHGSLGHGNSLYQELIHVPLIIKLPPSYKKPIISVIDEPASIIDIMPTIL